MDSTGTEKLSTSTNESSLRDETSKTLSMLENMESHTNKCIENVKKRIRSYGIQSAIRNYTTNIRRNDLKHINSLFSHRLEKKILTHTDLQHDIQSDK